MIHVYLRLPVNSEKNGTFGEVRMWNVLKGRAL